jgi:SAM-dependent methyltransferase
MTPGALDQSLGSRNPAADPIPRLYPEVRAGGFTRNDHRIIFFARVNALLRRDMTVLDFGAGRGIWAEIESGFRLDLTTLKGKCKKVIGVDVDPIVVNNPLVDEAIVLPDDGSIPLPDQSVDMIVSWAVFEHLEDPAHTTAELDRILRPGGWICSWTPNKWGYISIGARLIPNRFHTSVLRRIHPTSQRQESDVFPTFYRINTLRELRRHFPTGHFEHFSYIFNGEPTYHANSFLLVLAMDAAGRLMPEYFAKSLHVFIRKRSLHRGTVGQPDAG